MAKAEVKNALIVSLTLDVEEALTLRRLLGWHIVGPDEGPRASLDELWRVLKGLDNVMWDADETIPFNTTTDYVFADRLYLAPDDGRDCSNTDENPAMEIDHA